MLEFIFFVGFGWFKDLVKWEVIFEVVKCLFFCNGYDGSSMEVIVLEVGVFKFIVYSYFIDKEILFSEVVKVKCVE